MFWLLTSPHYLSARAPLIVMLQSLGFVVKLVSSKLLTSKLTLKLMSSKLFILSVTTGQAAVSLKSTCPVGRGASHLCKPIAEVPGTHSLAAGSCESV